MRALITSADFKGETDKIDVEIRTKIKAEFDGGNNWLERPDLLRLLANTMPMWPQDELDFLIGRLLDFAKKSELSELTTERYLRLLENYLVGGGTPSYIDAKYIKEILEEIRNKKVFREAEITIEVNPGTVTLEKLKEYKEGDKVGNIYIYINDELLATKDIYVSKDIEKNKKSFWQKIWEVIKFW